MMILRQLGKALEDARSPNLRSSQGGQRPVRTMPHHFKDLSLPACSCPGLSPHCPPAPYLEEASAAADRRRCWSGRSSSANSAGAPPRPPLLHAAGSREGLLGRGFWAAGRPAPPGNRGARSPGPAPRYTWRTRRSLIGESGRGGSGSLPKETESQEGGYPATGSLKGRRGSQAVSEASAEFTVRLKVEANSKPSAFSPANTFHIPSMHFLGKWVKYTINKSSISLRDLEEGDEPLSGARLHY